MIPEIRRILFTTDLSPNADTAFKYAISIANRYCAELALLHVMEDVSASADARMKNFIGEDRWKEIKGSQEEEARQILIGKKKEGSVIRDALGEFCELVQNSSQTDVKVDQINVVRGNVVDEILSESKRLDCDLIVMGYHIRGKIEEAVIGSTTRKVLRRSRIPVMMVQLVEEE